MLQGNGVVGIRREDKNKWERRVPVTPEQVKTLVAQGIRVLIQPSNIRVFPNNAYVEAGAELTEDLSPASLILAVKEVPIHLLLPERSYMFFSHTIKAQPANMPLLDALLEKKVRMIDYECITENGQRGAKRLVAFGRFAGVAGMIDFFRGMGERFLALGYSTPFLSIGATYMYPDLDTAYAAVRVCGESVRRYGLPADLAPLTVVFTGDGNVSKGAQEVFRQLGDCVKWVAPEELKDIVASASGAARTHTIYAAVATEKHMVAKRAGGSGSVPAGGFDKNDYRADPDSYEPIFHETVIPYTTILINSMYWDTRFPRLLSIKQAQALHAAKRLPLLGVCDITCDFQGSVEFLKEFTSIEAPYYVYDVEADAVKHDMDAPGILYHAVDHLPSECPRDASEHFGSCLLPFLPAIANSDGSKPFAEQEDLPLPIKGAVLCDHGALTPNFSYIATLRAAANRAAANRETRVARKETFFTIDLVGHLFDSGIINRILDALEETSKASVRILDFHVGKDRDTPTEMTLQVIAPGETTVAASADLAAALTKIKSLADSMGVSLNVDAEESWIHDAIAHSAAKTVPRSVSQPAKRVLVLGAGLVSAPLIEFLLRRPFNHLTVASMIASEAEAFARGDKRVTPVVLDVSREAAKLDTLVSDHDLVVSLVPAPCHPQVARCAIAHRKHMVTASYVSPEMRALHAEATAAGITILNEAGLDPGIDHMSAMAMIEAARERGGTITGFSSVCGGLPAPEAANNPLGYKFSWSPRGALSAARNAAKFLKDGQVVTVPGEALLTSAAPFRVNPAFSLEVIPNRDSLPYADKYGLAGPHLKTMFRGTLRYHSFCAHLHALVALGFLEVAEMPVMAGASLRDLLAAGAGLASTPADTDALFAAVVAKVSAAAGDRVEAHVKSLTALSPSLGAAARVAATSCAHVDLASNVSQQAALREVLEWAGFFDGAAVAPLRGGASGNGIDAPKVEVLAKEAAAAGRPGPSGPTTHVPLDTLVAVLTSKPEMSFAAGERDMALMQHTLEVEFPDGSKEVTTATLIEYADMAKKQTSMARTVGYTAAIGAQLILDGRVHTLGVVEPVTKEWYVPMLEALEHEGIIMHETTKVIPPGK